MSKWILGIVLAFATDGLMPYEPGDGITAIVRGLLSKESFKLESVRIVGARLGGRAADPDQFRVMLLDAEGRQIGLVTTWSPLLTFEWNGEKESATESPQRVVDILFPASLGLESVALGWTEGREVARVSVGEEIRKFCEAAATRCQR
jgi:hypothetical protein